MVPSPHAAFIRPSTCAVGLTAMLLAYFNGSGRLRLADVVAVGSYFQKTGGYFQGWRIVSNKYVKPILL